MCRRNVHVTLGGGVVSCLSVTVSVLIKADGHRRIFIPILSTSAITPILICSFILLFTFKQLRVTAPELASS